MVEVVDGWMWGHAAVEVGGDMRRVAHWRGIEEAVEEGGNNDEEVGGERRRRR